MSKKTLSPVVSALAPQPLAPQVPFKIMITAGAVAGLIDTAFAPEQAARKIEQYSAKWPEAKFECVPNVLAPAVALAEENAETFKALQKFKQAVIDNTGTDDPHVMARAFRIVEKIDAAHAQLDAKAAKLDERAAAMTPPPEVEHPDPVPFEVGDYVKDTHGDQIVRVTEILADAFKWANFSAGTSGTIGRANFGDYKKLSQKAAKPHLVRDEEIAADAVAAAQSAQAAIDALAGESPVFPFGVGDTVSNEHTPDLIRVTAVGPDCTLNRSAAANGFDWEAIAPDAKEKTGHCPLNAVGNFQLHGKRVSTPPPRAAASAESGARTPRQKKSAHKEKPAKAHAATPHARKSKG